MQTTHLKISPTGSINSVYVAHCKTTAIARELTGKGNVSTVTSAQYQRPPHCLRIVKQYRTYETTQFRNFIAKVVKIRRSYGAV